MLIRTIKNNGPKISNTLISLKYILIAGIIFEIRIIIKDCINIDSIYNSKERRPKKPIVLSKLIFVFSFLHNKITIKKIRQHAEIDTKKRNKRIKHF